MTFLIDELQLPSCLFISGDVHYGMNLQVACSWKDKGLPITQLVSSAQKHAGVLSKTALNLVGKIVPNTHERIGWDRPPRSARSTAITRRLLRPAQHQRVVRERPPLPRAPPRAAAQHSGAARLPRATTVCAGLGAAHVDDPGGQQRRAGVDHGRRGHPPAAVPYGWGRPHLHGHHEDEADDSPHTPEAARRERHGYSLRWESLAESIEGLSHETRRMSPPSAGPLSGRCLPTRAG